MTNFWDTTLKKSTAATTGALVTSLLVTPLDVAKVRLQAQLQPVPLQEIPSCFPCVSRNLKRASGVLCGIHCSVGARNKGYMGCPPGCPQCMRLSSLARVRVTHSAPKVPTLPLNGTMDALKYVFRTEGAVGLWSGITPALVIAVPSTVLYFSSYDHLLDSIQTQAPQYRMLAPMLAGSLARGIAATVVSPMELIRTRIQAEAGSTSIRQLIVETMGRGGVTSLFRGLNATLARDVPFSAIYWTCYEQFKGTFEEITILHKTIELGTAGRSFLAGASAGMVAATITTPFDVVKTLKQIESSKGNGMMTQRSTFALLKHIIATEGVRGTMVGLSARLAKIAPACAIMISSYELGKVYLGIEK